MSKQWLDVGQITHTSSDYLLKLTSSSSIHLSFPFNARISSTKTSMIEQLIADGWWIARGDGLRLAIGLVFHDITMDGVERQKIVGELGTMIRDAEVL